MTKTSAADMKAAIKYQAAHIRRIVLNLNDRTDSDLIEFIDKVKNKQGLLKRLLREEMKRTQR